MSGKLVWDIARGTVSEFFKDRALRLSATLAYYAMFSLAPLLIIVIGLTSLVFGEEAVRGQVQEQLRGFIGSDAAQVVESMIAARSQKTSVIATIIGIITLLLGASGLLGQLEDALNTIWEVAAKPGRGVLGFVKDRFLSFTMVLGTGFLLLISMVITTALEALMARFNEMLVMPLPMAQGVNVVSFLVTTLLFAMIYKVLPDVRVKWRDVWIGAVATSLLFSAGKYLLGLYLGHESTASAYGAAGSVIVVLLWVYYSSLILFLGAEFTQVYATKTGSWVVPAENAAPLTAEAGAQQGMPSPEHVEWAAKQAEAVRARRVTLAIARKPSWRYAGLALGFGLITGWWLHHSKQPRG